MGKKSDYPGPEHAYDAFAELVDAHPDAELKGAKNPYCSRNGHMFAFLDPTGLVAIRLSKDDMARFNDEYGGGPVEQYGRTMQGYVAVTDDLAADFDRLLGWFSTSWDHIGTLPPKATKKPAKKARATKKPAKKKT